MNGFWKVTFAGLAVLALVAFAVPANANTIKLERDTTKYSGANGGGEFKVTSYDGYFKPQSSTVNAFGGKFQTFCVQQDEGIDLTQTWDWKENTETLHATKSPVALTDEAAYLFKSWYYEQLGAGTATSADDYDYGSGRVQAANDLQAALWHHMGWTGTTLSTRAKAWYDEAETAVNNGYKNRGVRILNLTRVDSAGKVVHAQDMLVLVPLPSAALGGLLLLAGLGVAARVRRRKK